MKRICESATVLMLSFLLILVAQGCSSRSSSSDRPSKGAMRGEATPVVAVKVVKKDVPIDIQSVGTVEASSTVTVKSQVSGELMQVFFQEGSFVKKGDKLFFIDNAVDVTTGTILVKAVFTNRGHALWPGEFVRVVLRLGARLGALIVPSQAVQTGQEGTFIFVIRPDQTVESRPVVPGMRVNGEIVIEKGLESGEVVVTEGQLRLTAGSRVQVRGPS